MEQGLCGRGAGKGEGCQRGPGLSVASDTQGAQRCLRAGVGRLGPALSVQRARRPASAGLPSSALFSFTSLNSLSLMIWVKRLKPLKVKG